MPTTTRTSGSDATVGPGHEADDDDQAEDVSATCMRHSAGSASPPIRSISVVRRW